jgi:hypothetical protein
MPRKNFISVTLGIQISLDNDRSTAKAMCDTYQDQDRIPTPKTTSFKKVHYSHGVLEPCYQLDEWKNLDKPEKRTLFNCCLSQLRCVRAQHDLRGDISSTHNQRMVDVHVAHPRACDCADIRLIL